MSELKCEQCGKTFGDNENVIGIGSGVNQKPYCRKCAEALTGKSLPKAGQDSGQGKCFVATAACGDENAWEVLALRHYRDTVLLRSVLGRAFVEIYYFLSPKPAGLLARSAGLCWVVRSLLIQPVARLIQKRME